MWVDSEKIDVPLLNTGIAWDADRKIKFRNPPGDLREAFQGKFAKPKAWRVPVYELDPDNPDNNGFQNEDLIVWMRTAAFPTFRKLYRRIDHSQTGFVNGLRKGDYELKVEYSKYILFFFWAFCIVKLGYSVFEETLKMSLLKSLLYVLGKNNTKFCMMIVYQIFLYSINTK